MNAKAEAFWLSDSTSRAALIVELNQFLDAVSALRSVVEWNSTEGIEAGYCKVEPAIKMPRMVRELAKANEQLRKAYEACKTRAMIDEFLGIQSGFRVGPDPMKDAGYIASIVVPVQHLQQVATKVSAEIKRKCKLDRKTRSDSPSDALKAKCLALKDGHTWAEVRRTIHSNHARLLPEKHRNDEDYPSDETMQRWQRNASKRSS